MMAELLLEFSPSGYLTDTQPVPLYVDTQEDYMPRARAECQRFIALLRRKCGPEPEGARLAVKSFLHDFGDYLEVVCYFDENLPCIS
jgi:hypothetical protein